MDVGTLNLLVLLIIINSHLTLLLVFYYYYVLFQSTLYKSDKTVAKMYILYKEQQNTIIKTLLKK